MLSVWLSVYRTIHPVPNAWIPFSLFYNWLQLLSTLWFALNQPMLKEDLWTPCSLFLLKTGGNLPLQCDNLWDQFWVEVVCINILVSHVPCLVDLSHLRWLLCYWRVFFKKKTRALLNWRKPESVIKLNFSKT